MCGIVGIFSHTPVASALYDSLIHLQHRGQDAAGMITSAGKFYVKHGLGYVREIFSADDLAYLRGHSGIAHVRYPTAGGHDIEDVQPFWTGSPRGIALAHNGNLVNHTALATVMTQHKHRHLNSSSDSEVLLHLLAEDLENAEKNKVDLTSSAAMFDALCDAVLHILQVARGSYSVVSQIIGRGLLAFRDAHGIRPLVCGERHIERQENKEKKEEKEIKKDYIFASEDTMFSALGFTATGDVAPGEVVFVDQQGVLFRRQLIKKTFAPCIFEHVYFARPDATLDGVSVYQARQRMGEKLAAHWQSVHPDSLPDVVVPAPFTSNTAAAAFALALGVRYAEGLYKNAFIGRTFIMPDGQARHRHVRYKLTAQKTELAGKCVLILDDSIVRGTTSREIARIVREAGAKEIYFVSACPPVKFPCFYGIDMPSKNELIANERHRDAIREFLGVDILLYQTQDDLQAAVRTTQQADYQPCMACLDGKYIVGTTGCLE